MATVNDLIAVSKHVIFIFDNGLESLNRELGARRLLLCHLFR